MYLMIDDFKAPSSSDTNPKQNNTEQIERSYQQDDISELTDPLSSYDASTFSTEAMNVRPAPEPHEPDSPKNDLKPSKQPEKTRRFKLPKLTRKQWLIFGGVALLLTLSTGFLVWKVLNKPDSQPVVLEAKPPEPPKPKVFTSKLTGAKVSEAESNLPVTAIMIENSPDARPQSGIKDAGVVFEAVAEGGITRFLTLFQEAKPGYIGPIRSVRPYYLDWLVPFDAPVAHVGGSAEALAQIRNEGIKDLDYGSNSDYYQRINSRYAPHNVYTSRDRLLELHTAKGWTKSDFTSWERKSDNKTPTPTAKALDFNISSYLYNPHFDYIAETNSYHRSQAGQPHVDEKTNAVIDAKVVIAIVVPKSLHPDGTHTIYATHGSGKAYIFQDGTVTVGKWEKPERKKQIIFKTNTGDTIKLDTGMVWVSVVGEEGAVKYTP